MGASSLFRSRVTLISPKRTETGGDVKYSYNTASASVSSGIACEIQAGRSAEDIEFGRVTGRTRYTGWFRSSQGIQLADRVTWTPPRGSTAKTLEVASPPRHPDGTGDHIEVDLEEVK